ncbi:MAG: VanW family protein [Huintestinicola sp.]|uniref:VanW family protein n=1 Tax=Huintestinicola sp. TaxID=2981661 RepID=UPI003F09BF95
MVVYKGGKAMQGRRKLFCECGKICYNISLIKEYLLRDIRDIISVFGGTRFAKERSAEEMPVIIKGHLSVIARKLAGVDMELQRNKETNLKIAAERINGLMIRPGEVFSFWRLIGRPTAKKGYLEGLTISRGRLGRACGGGLCQLANLIHWLILNSPLEVTELHHHSDALFPDERRRVPFGTGTSVFYKNVDYRFKNTLSEPVQLLVWVDKGVLYGELRGNTSPEYRYVIREEGHHFAKEGEDYFRCSLVYRDVFDRESGELVRTELILTNHSKVMYDHSLIPKEEIVS